MDVKKAVEILTQERERIAAKEPRIQAAYDMAIFALRMQDGKLFLPSLDSWTFQYKEEE